MGAWRSRIAAIAKLYARRDQPGRTGRSRFGEGRQVEEGGAGRGRDTAEVEKKKQHQQGVAWIRGDREQESGSRSIKGPIKRSGVCTKSASGM